MKAVWGQYACPRCGASVKVSNAYCDACLEEMIENEYQEDD